MVNGVRNGYWQLPWKPITPELGFQINIRRIFVLLWGRSHGPRMKGRDLSDSVITQTQSGQMRRHGYPEAVLNYTENGLINPSEECVLLFDQYMQFVHQSRECLLIMWFQPIKVPQATQKGRVSIHPLSMDEGGLNEGEMHCTGGIPTHFSASAQATSPVRSKRTSCKSQPTF